MSFVQVQQSLVTHRKTLRLARLLSLDRYATVGRLVALWAWALDNALDGVFGDDIDAEVVADVMGWEGKPAELLEALITAGFLDVAPDEQGAARLHIHDWHEHMGRLIEKREQDAERKRRQRERERESQGESAIADAAVTSNAGPASADVDVTQMSRGRHADVTHQSRVEKNISTGTVIPKERERAQTHATPAADAALAPSSPAPSQSLPSSKVTPLRAPTPATTTTARVPDPVWDACIAAMGQNGRAPTNRVERGRWAKGIQALNESLAADGSPPTEIVTRARRYRARFGTGVPLHPMALAGNWTTLATDIPQATHGTQEGQRHGNFRQSAGQTAATHGRPASGYGARTGKPAVGSAAYYAAAISQAARSGQHGSGAGEGIRDAVVG